MTVLTPQAAYRLWSATYDRDPNPVLALEERMLRRRLDLGSGDIVLDLAAGTGRWLEHALARGARGFGLDLSPEMLAQAGAKGMAGKLVQATLTKLPFPDDFADLAICSFALGYLASLVAAFREIARTCRRSIVSDLHPDAVRAGWVRSFRAGGCKYEISSHAQSLERLERAARAAGLKRVWQLEPRFGVSEREIFEWAGKSAAFDEASKVPAIFISCWERS